MLQCLEKNNMSHGDKRNQPQVGTICASNGTSVSLKTENGLEKISVRSEKGQIIFEYQPDTKKCCFTVPEGDLFINAPLGNISFTAGHNIQMKCPGEINITGEQKVTMHSGKLRDRNSEFILDNQQVQLRGSKVSVAAQDGEFAIAKAYLRSRRLAAKIDRARVSLENLEIVAETFRQKTNDFVQNVENLLQINAGKMRTFVRGLYNLKGERTYLKADKDMKLKGEKIHLR